MNAWPWPDLVEINLVDPFEVHVGPAWQRGPPGDRCFAFRVDERHVNRRRVLHGGMLLTFADLALGAAAWDATDRAPCVTLGMQTQFLKPAQIGDIVEVKPLLMRRTRALLFLRGDFKVEGDVIFTATSVWKLLGQD
jgi:acyl-coenzyme A thioesterase PaaI-like protein